MIDESDIDIKAMKKRLLRLRDDILDIEASDHESTKPVELDQSRVGRLSRMDALQGQAMSLEMKNRRKIELQRITAALRRIEEGDYGGCVVCGEQIAYQRLVADPVAPLCIDCANKSEI